MFETRTKGEDLHSTYDRGLPAALRGEAVRSAMRSDRGICIDFTSSYNRNLNVDVVKVMGNGCLNFLNSKLTNTFTLHDQPDTKTISKNGVGLNIERGSMKQACILTSKGRIIDSLIVTTFASDQPDSNSMEANLITSPGHSGSALYNLLDPFIFPLDEVKLKDLCSKTTNDKKETTRVFALCATKLDSVQSNIRKFVCPFFDDAGIPLTSSISFPSSDRGECLRFSSVTHDGRRVALTLISNTFLPRCSCEGYTLMITEDSNDDDMEISSQIWKKLVAENNLEGPVEIGPLEFDTLRIESGQPGFGFEMTGDGDKDHEDSNVSLRIKSNASPLELHLEDLIDEEKGCYQGQEGVASIIKNKRGPPRLLYSVFFDEEENFYEGQEDEERYSNHESRLRNRTFRPSEGDELFVLGSNQEIKVGTLTSVAESGGTGIAGVVALALVRRSESILKKMRVMDLDIDLGKSSFNDDPLWSDGSDEYRIEDGGIIYPPPLDHLDGLEVVIGGSFTRGVLRACPYRRLRANQQMFETDIWASEENDITGGVFGTIPQASIGESIEYNKKEEESQLQSSKKEDIRETRKVKEIEDFPAESEAEAKRKTEKLRRMKARAEAVIEARKKQKEEGLKNEEDDKDVLALEQKRKKDKMEMLRKQAEAAMARRRNNS